MRSDTHKSEIITMNGKCILKFESIGINWAPRYTLYWSARMNPDRSEGQVCGSDILIPHSLNQRATRLVTMIMAVEYLKFT